MAAKVDWSYHRANCNTCAKTQAFLNQAGVKTVEEVNARKTKYQQPEALELARKVEQLYATKGTKIIHVDLKKDRPDDETLASLLIGPSGTMRAPALRVGKTLIVGFHQETYDKLLG